ncbi:hypothetical protein FHR95_000139 [Halomonas fontilapidosi]|uniref:Uncharacterized protein n=1 Tax=Halomonas fontilapidosi TaxID=616675 RepID=A0A7W5GXI8_9GAMM|nr:hypothetical protein [Halomonas fontilapidosi]MBB3182615.1 hypothetical protein [Halomonas fontilapidosi]
MNTPSVTYLNNHFLRQTERPTSVVTMIEDLLALAGGHEHNEYQRYYWLSLRFLTYHIGISKLLQALAEESQQRIQALTKVAATLPIALPRLGEPVVGPWPDLHGQGHFFIYDDAMAAQELSRAELEEWRSRRFYERLQDYNAIPALDAWLNECIGQCRAQFQILHEARYQCPGLTRVNAHTA